MPSGMRSIVTVMVFLVTGLTLSASGSNAMEVTLNGEWDFAYTVASASDIPGIPPPAAFDAKIMVPGRWDDQLDRLGGATWWHEAKFVSTVGPIKYLSGVGWHRTQIDAPASWQGRSVTLTIGWAVGRTHVWLNRQHLGSYDYGVYTPYSLDLTPHLKIGLKNEVIIAVDNTRGFAGGWAFLGCPGKASGISRPVTLYVSDGPGRISDMYVRPGADLKEAVWEVELEVPGGDGNAPESKLLWEVRTADKRTILAQGEVGVPAFSKSRRVSWRQRVDEIHPWSDRQPNLYWASARWLSAERQVWDAREQRFGLRRWSYDGRKLLLNGQPIYLRGEFGFYYFPIECAIPTSKDFYLTHLKRAKQIGMNFINFAAKVAPIEMLEAADELGVIIQCGDETTALEENRQYYKDVWVPILRLTRKYPSMCIYGYGGEHNYYEGIIEQYQKQYDLIKSLNPECLVMPQQAIRGIDYSFDEQDGKDLTPNPFPHHAARLERYTGACDLFGHYSGGAFGYNFFDTPWRVMEERFLIYRRPLVAHELYMRSSYLNPDNARKYTGRIPPFFYTRLEEDLAKAGLADRWQTYSNNSGRLNAIARKYCVEKTRKCDGLTGFEFLGMMDQHYTMHLYPTGMLDEFLQLKPGDSVEGILRYNNESVLLLDFAGDSINRSYWAGEPFQADIMVSLYGAEPVKNGKLSWALKEGDAVVLNGAHTIPDIRNGRVSTLQTLKFQWPAARKTTKLNLCVKLTGDGCDIANDWDFWVFPKVGAPDVAAAADDRSYGIVSARPVPTSWFGARYRGVSRLTKDSREKLRIVSEIGHDEIRHLASGGDALLLGVKPFPSVGPSQRYPGHGGRAGEAVGAVIRQHPILEGLPDEGWGDWPFLPLLRSAPSVSFDDLETKFDPIVEFIGNPTYVQKQAVIFEERVGQGRLLVSTCAMDMSNPSCVALMDGLLRYMTSVQFHPSDRLDPEALTALTAPPLPRDPKNLFPCPDFEKPNEVRSNLGRSVGRCEVDSTTAHTGKKSLKLLPNDFVDACAHISFKKTPPLIKLSAWHKTQDLEGKKGTDFDIYVYVTYKDGHRDRLALLLETGTHDWQYAETIWRPKKEIARADFHIGYSRPKKGTAWIDDIYFGEALETGAVSLPRGGEAPGEPIWHNKAVTLNFKSEVHFRVNDGEWGRGLKVTVADEGINKVYVKKSRTAEKAEVQEVRIDLTEPVIKLAPYRSGTGLAGKPPLNQLGGVYYAPPETTFSIEASDELSGVKTIEVSKDGGEYVPYHEPFNLAAGMHRIRCRVTDAAGNRSEIMGGESLTGGRTDCVSIVVGASGTGPGQK